MRSKSEELWGRERHSITVGAYESGVAALAGEPLGRHCERAGRVCEWARARGTGTRVDCQSTASQALCWALYGDSLVTSAVVVNS